MVDVLRPLGSIGDFLNRAIFRRLRHTYAKRIVAGSGGIEPGSLADQAMPLDDSRFFLIPILQDLARPQGFEP